MVVRSSFLLFFLSLHLLVYAQKEPTEFMLNVTSIDGQPMTGVYSISVIFLTENCRL